MQCSSSLAFPYLRGHLLSLSVFRYFEDALQKLLDIAQDKKRIAPSDLARNPVHARFSAFKERKLFEVAGEVRCDTILSHPLGRRSLPEDWNRPSVRNYLTFHLKRL